MIKKILLVEDDPDIIKLLQLHLNEPVYELTACSSGTEAIRMVHDGNFDFVLLDIMLPDEDGIEVCRAIRQQQISTPIMMLSSRSEEIDKVVALEMGADDYLTKPFSMRELMARIKAHLRREHLPLSVSESQHEIRVNDLVIDNDLKKVCLKNQRIELTQKEFDLLLLLARNPGKTFSRLELLAKVWGYTISGYEHTVTSHINRLRIKLETDLSNPRYILTSWGVGYRFSDEIEDK